MMHGRMWFPNIKNYEMTKLAKRCSLAVSALTCAVFATTQAQAVELINFDGFSYTGDVTVFDTLNDAQNSQNKLSGPHTIPTVTNGPRSTLTEARDAALFADTSEGSLQFLTAWYFTPQDVLSNNSSVANGSGNPNNTNTGFVQMFDSDGSSVDTLDIGWENNNTEFSVEASGQNAGASEFARLWPAPVNGGAGAISAGEFLEYELDFTAIFNDPVSSPGSGTSTSSLPDDVTGSFTGIFENTNTSDTSLNGFYTIDFSFQNQSYALQNDAVVQFRPNTNVASQFTVPLPGSAMLFGTSLVIAGLGAAARFGKYSRV